MYYAIKINTEKYDGPEPMNVSAASFYQKYSQIFLFEDKKTQTSFISMINEGFAAPRFTTVHKCDIISSMTHYATIIAHNKEIKCRDEKYFIEDKELDKNCPEYDFKYITFLKD